MKKTILASLLIAGLTVSGYSQGVIYFDGSNNHNASAGAASGGQVFLNGNLDTTQDINAQLLMFNGTSYVPVVTLLLSAGTTATTTVNFGSTQGAVGDITDFGGGAPFDASGNGYQENFAAYPAGSVGQFEVAGWMGQFSSLAAAQTAGQLTGITGPFNVTLTSPTGTANDISSMPALVLTTVPEPSIIALCGLGSAAFMLIRRRK
jgi:hypothetical protein